MREREGERGRERGGEERKSGSEREGEGKREEGLTVARQRLKKTK